jgi:hypothetical protein
VGLVNAIDAVAVAILGNADDHDSGLIDYDTFNRRARMLWDSVHRSDHDAVVVAIEKLAARSDAPGRRS